MGHWLLGHAFEVLTMERFSYWAGLLALPFVGLLTVKLVDKYRLPGGHCPRDFGGMDLRNGSCVGHLSNHECTGSERRCSG